MPFSHHSHSGEFCPGHATDSLEEAIKTAISKGLLVFGLTEHMPRHDIDGYPEEKKKGHSMAWQLKNEAAYHVQALRLRSKYASQIEVPIGFECDWIRPESKNLIEMSINSHAFDYFIGSVHHVHTIPIDYDQPMYDDARDRAGGTDDRLFEDYFDAQLDMLRAVKPPVVGHFDLIRLKSANPNNGFQQMSGVWERVLRNLDFVASYGGIMEVNTAALRKGMTEPYPKKEICKAALQRGIRFCLSDDSHGISQIAYGYQQALEFLKDCGVQILHYLKHTDSESEVVDSRFPSLEICQVELKEVGSSPTD